MYSEEAQREHRRALDWMKFLKLKEPLSSQEIYSWLKAEDKQCWLSDIDVGCLGILNKLTEEKSTDNIKELHHLLL